eukprot:gene10660-12607_t
MAPEKRERTNMRGTCVFGVLCLIMPYTAASKLAESNMGSAVVNELYSWGLNSVGQLGLVDFHDRTKPSVISVLRAPNITHLAVGGSEKVDSHSLAIAVPGKLFTTGDNTYGQLGLGDNTDRESFVPVRTVFAETFVAVSAGETHSLALTDKGEIYAWGSNTRGQIALEDTATPSSAPRKLTVPKYLALELEPPIEPKTIKFRGIAAGAWHSSMPAVDMLAEYAG